MRRTSGVADVADIEAMCAVISKAGAAILGNRKFRTANMIPWRSGNRICATNSPFTEVGVAARAENCKSHKSCATSDYRFNFAQVAFLIAKSQGFDCRLLCCRSYPASGVMRQIAERLAARGHDVAAEVVITGENRRLSTAIRVTRSTRAGRWSMALTVNRTLSRVRRKIRS